MESIRGGPSMLENYSDEDEGSRSGKHRDGRRRSGRCICARYLKSLETHHKGQARRKQPGQPVADVDLLEALQSLGDFDAMHCFVAILSGGLNLAKRIIRLHFSIDVQAYANLPQPGRSSWQDGMLPWYRELHRPDAHGRSRYSMLLECVVHGLLGDGYTSGLHDEVLDILRVSHDTKGELCGDSSEVASLTMKAPQAAEVLDPRQRKNVSHRASSVSTLSPGGPGLAIGVQSRQRAFSGVGAAGGSMASLGAGTQQAQPQQFSHQKEVPSTPVAPTGGMATTRAHSKGVLSEIILWTELYEAESLMNHRTHFENFTQWCHSAQLIPFLLRCYRRCGIAGLIPGQRSGGHKHGVDPSHPLVLPTVSNFCYGHCYPLHRVLEYFYGGMERIVCSCDDPLVVEEDRSQLGLIAGQERLNNQCWFQLSDRDAFHLAEHMPSQNMNAALNKVLLQQLEEQLNNAGKPPRPSSVDGRSHSIVQSKHGFDEDDNDERRGSFARSLKGMGKRNTRMSSVSQLLAAAPTPGRKQNFGRSRRKVGGRSSGERQPRRRPTRQAASLGLLAPEDPFFWFCQQNFALYTYPATNISRNLLNEGHGLVLRYSDFVSRTGTPQRRRDRPGNGEGYDGYIEEEIDDYRSSMYGDGQPVVASINLCQPTDATSHIRQRWEVKKEFIDDQKLILGDAGWFPGAQGHRFTFEVTTAHVERYVRLSVVPQAQLLYMEHAVVPHSKKDRSDSLPQDLTDADSSDSGGESPATAANTRRRRFTKGNSPTSGVSNAEQAPRSMLPPLLPAKTC